MNQKKLALLLATALTFAATSAFASYTQDYSANVTVNTSALAGTTGYLYLQYDNEGTTVASTAVVSATGAAFGAQDTQDVANGAAVTGTTLASPSSVSFLNTNTVNDFLQQVTFGQTLSFNVNLNSTPSAITPTEVSTLSIGVFADAFGATPLLNVTGNGNANLAGTVAAINLEDNGTGSAVSLDASTTATPTPIPAAFWLLGSGLVGLVGKRKKMTV